MADVNIMKFRGWPDVRYLRAACGCMEKSHDQEIWIEVSRDEAHLINVTISQDIYHDTAALYCDLNPFKRAWQRVKGAVKLLFTGTLEFQSSFCFEDEQQVNSYLESILLAMHEVKAEAKRQRDERGE